MDEDKAIARRLCSAILKQAFDDWEALEFGNWDTRFITGQNIHKTELLIFFKSDVFKQMCEFALRTPVSRIMKAMQIPTEG